MLLYHTDLAMENLDPNASLPGVDVHRWIESDIELSEVVIRSPEAARDLNKPCGSYLTLECRLLREHDPDARVAMSALLSEELGRMLPPESDAPVLVVGLGNREVTPDALGPAVVDRTLVTRHVVNSAFFAGQLRSVCAIAPGVLGITGVETMEMVESIVHALQPRLVICIDALAARDSERIGCTIQLTDTGIQPGAGVGNHRRPLTEESLGVKVIAVGVPTVIYAATLARDAFALLSGKEESDEALNAMERELLETNLGNLIVTPRDVDAIVKNSAILIASGLNRALQPDLSEAEIAQMMD